MNLVGKILVVLILIMSVFFMSTALMVYATHRNWRDLVENPTAAAGKPKGLRLQLQDQQRINAELQQKIDQAKNELARERAARRYALAALEERASSLNEQFVAKEKQYQELFAKHESAITSMELAQNNLARLTTEVTGLRDRVRTVQEDRDAQLSEVVQLTNDIQESRGVVERLEETNNQLVAQVGRMNRVLERNDLSEFTPLHDVPPKLFGEVTMVRGTDLIVVSLGTDDGIRVGHKLEVYRPGGSYLGRIVVTDTNPDRSVAKVIPEFRQGSIRKGDRVATRLI